MFNNVNVFKNILSIFVWVFDPSSRIISRYVNIYKFKWWVKSKKDNIPWYRLFDISYIQIIARGTSKTVPEVDDFTRIFHITFK